MKSTTQVFLVIVVGISLLSFVIYSKFNKAGIEQEVQIYPQASAPTMNYNDSKFSGLALQSTVKNINPQVGESGSPLQQASAEFITGKVVQINTNANKVTFINVKDTDTNQLVTYMTMLKRESINIDRGDIVKISKNLDKSQNGLYYLISSSVDYQVLNKNTAVIASTNSKVEIRDISSDLMGLDVMTSGKVVDLHTSQKGHNFFELSNGTDHIKAVMFAAESSELASRQQTLEQAAQGNQEVNVRGKVSVYKGELEIIIEKIWK